MDVYRGTVMMGFNVCVHSVYTQECYNHYLRNGKKVNGKESYLLELATHNNLSTGIAVNVNV